MRSSSGRRRAASKDFDIHISGNTLTIQAEHKEEGEEKEEGYRRWHQRYGRFQHSIPLSTAVNTDNVEARYRNGLGWRFICPGQSQAPRGVSRSRRRHRGRGAFCAAGVGSRFLVPAGM